MFEMTDDGFVYKPNENKRDHITVVDDGDGTVAILQPTDRFQIARGDGRPTAWIALDIDHLRSFGEAIIQLCDDWKMPPADSA